MQRFSYSPKAMVGSLLINKELIITLVKREVAGRYRGSMMGILWSFFQPIFMLAVYTFVFSVVFKSRWNMGNDSKTEFALVLYVGLIVFNLFAECVNRAPRIILSNVNYVKKVVFPLEILPWVIIGSSLFHLGIGLAVWFIFYVFFFGVPSVSILLAPLVLLPLIMMTMGFSWLLASLGVYVRDVEQLIGIFTSALMFVSPIFYPISILPTNYQRLLFLNPITPVIEYTRGVLLWGQTPDWTFFGIYLFVTSIIAWAGFAWFQKTRKGFADVL